jgi:DNA mismatch repair protein MutL
MSPSDAVLCFQRHATSKLRQVDDLWGIASMGFRGEALPAIASVARVQLTTRRAADLAATRISIEGGSAPVVTEAGAPAGTTVEVTDLLYNVPARLKFLKGDATEASHITETVARLAMAHPTIGFRLRHGGRIALELPPERDGFARAKALLGARTSSGLVQVSGEEGGVRVTAFLAAPELAQTTARGVQLFVDRRAIRDRNLLHAVAMGYGELVPRGRYPVAIVLLDIPAGAVDVNVHPQKVEVRFVDAPAVAAAVRHVVQSGVASAPWRDAIGAPIQMLASIAPPRLPVDGPATELADRYARDLRRGTQGSLGFDAPVARPVRPRAWAADVRARASGTLPADRPHPAPHWNPASASPAASPSATAFDAPPGDAASAHDVRTSDSSSNLVLFETPASTSPSDPATAPGTYSDDGIAVTVPGYFSSLRFLGQLDLTYLVCEADGELVLVDQHSAHERTELARLLARADARDVATQRLLFPMTVEASAAHTALVGRIGSLLAQVGYEAEPFGPTTIAIKAVPAGIRHGDPAVLLRRILDDVARDPDADHIRRMLAEIACHSVVRAGDRLAPPEAEALLRALDGIDLTGPAPHDRALVLRLPLAEIGRRFGR